MNCPVCREGTLHPAPVTVVLERGRSTIVFRMVPADVCSICGEEYVSSEVTAELLKRGEAESARHVDVEVMQFA